jgi:hypothetical protein
MGKYDILSPIMGLENIQPARRGSRERERAEANVPLHAHLSPEALTLTKSRENIGLNDILEPKNRRYRDLLGSYLDNNINNRRQARRIGQALLRMDENYGPEKLVHDLSNEDFALLGDSLNVLSERLSVSDVLIEHITPNRIAVLSDNNPELRRALSIAGDNKAEDLLQAIFERSAINTEENFSPIYDLINNVATIRTQEARWEMRRSDKKLGELTKKYNFDTESLMKYIDPNDPNGSRERVREELIRKGVPLGMRTIAAFRLTHAATKAEERMEDSEQELNIIANTLSTTLSDEGILRDATADVLADRLKTDNEKKSRESYINAQGGLDSARNLVSPDGSLNNNIQNAWTQYCSDRPGEDYNNPNFKRAFGRNYFDDKNELHGFWSWVLRSFFTNFFNSNVLNKLEAPSS